MQVCQLSQQELDRLLAEAYQRGFNDGYALATDWEQLEIRAISQQFKNIM